MREEDMAVRTWGYGYSLCVVSCVRFAQAYASHRRRVRPRWQGLEGEADSVLLAKRTMAFHGQDWGGKRPLSRSPATLWQPRGGIFTDLHLDAPGSKKIAVCSMMALNDGLSMVLRPVAAILPQVNWTPAQSPFLVSHASSHAAWIACFMCQKAFS